MSDPNAKPDRISSPARVEANRRLGQKSTGPKAPEGKAASRGNAVTHGLRCAIIEPENQRDLIDARAAEWAADLRPTDGAQTWLVRLAVGASGSTSASRPRSSVAPTWASGPPRCTSSSRSIARGNWVSRSGAPCATIEALEVTAAGCFWLIDQITPPVRELGEAFTDFNFDERRQALNLLGFEPDDFYGDPAHPVVGPFMRAGLATDLEHDPDDADLWTGLDTSELPELEARGAAHAKVLPLKDEGRLHCLAILAERPGEAPTRPQRAT